MKEKCKKILSLVLAGILAVSGGSVQAAERTSRGASMEQGLSYGASDFSGTSFNGTNVFSVSESDANLLKENLRSAIGVDISITFKPTSFPKNYINLLEIYDKDNNSNSESGNQQEISSTLNRIDMYNNQYDYMTGEDFEVYVVGGGDSAVEEAMYLTKFARKVTIIHRRNELRAAKSIQEKAFKNPKLEFMWDSVVEELGGDEILSEMTVKNVKTGELTKVTADEDDGMFGLFGFIGTVPNSKIFEGIIDMDERGYIKTDEDMHTNIPGVYAAGDVRIKSLRQVVTAAADGAIAAVQVERSMSDYF